MSLGPKVMRCAICHWSGVADCRRLSRRLSALRGAGLARGCVDLRRLLGGMWDIHPRGIDAVSTRYRRNLHLDNSDPAVAIVPGVFLETNFSFIEQPAHGVPQGGLADLGHFGFAFSCKYGWRAARPALPDEPTGQGQAAQDFQEDVLSPALGLRLFRGVRTVLTGELPRNHDAHRVGIRQVHVDEPAPGCRLRWC